MFGLDGPSAKKRKVSNGIDEKTYEYGTNLAVYDKRNRCILPDGDYQLLMHEIPQNSTKLQHVNTSWETIPDKGVGIKNYIISFSQCKPTC